MKATYKDFTIKANYKGQEASPHHKNTEYVPHWKITVKTSQGRTSFDFWGSIADGRAGKTELDEQELLWAFRCFVEDGISGQDDFDDFCDNFDYDQDSRKAEKIWKACQKSAKKLSRIWDGDVYELINQMSDDGIE